MIDEMIRLQTYIQSKYENAVVDLMTFHSGATTLDTRMKDLLLTFEYSPKEGFAVSRIVGVEDAYDPQKCVIFGKGEFNNAKDYYLSLVEIESLPM